MGFLEDPLRHLSVRFSRHFSALTFSLLFIFHLPARSVIHRLLAAQLLPFSFSLTPFVRDLPRLSSQSSGVFSSLFTLTAAHRSSIPQSEMPDPSDKGAETAADVASSDDGQSMESKKTCADCGTSKTPLWRGGPAGPKSLCNACGIRSRKKRRVSGGLSKEPEDMKKLKKNSISRLNSNSNRCSTAKFSNSWKRSLLGLGREVPLQRPSSSALNARQRQHRRKLGEVEQAAALLMALSYGSVYA